MISVSIFINGNPIYTRSAINRGAMMTNHKGETVCDRGYAEPIGDHMYEVDDGSVIIHAREKGAVDLAIEMLRTIKDSGKA